VTLLEEALDASGGLERWRSARQIRAHVRSGGLLLRTRAPGTKMARYELTVDVQRPRAVFDPFPGPGQRAVFEAGSARIETEAGEEIESRSNPRSFFFGRSGLRRNLRWDALDLTYFAGYAVWNYLTTPYLLTRDTIESREGEDWTEHGETWRRLEVTFPPSIDTHSEQQTFYFDGQGLLRRHDYTAGVIARFAHAAHYSDAHREFGGLVFPTRRRVVPIGPRNRALPGPKLVWVEVDGIEVG
jgi:hypothetical protein